tara:strand:+ start:2509 stop:5034 length:2526 start_codon:yes stop_codon:yes gene_type:complete
MIYGIFKKFGEASPDIITAKVAFGVALFAIALTLSMQNTPCLSASSCVVGASETFSGTLKINSGNTYGHTLSGTATADRTLTLPDVTGELFVAAFTGNGNKIMQVNGAGTAASYDFIDPLTQIDVTSGGTQTPLAGQLAQINSGANALTFGNVGIQNINDSGTAGEFLKSSGSALGFSKIGITDATQIDLGSGTSGQVLTVNQTATALEFGNFPASAGAFTATTAQSVVAGAVGLEANGTVRNIVAQQDAVSQLSLSQGSTGGSTTNIDWVSSIYNENVDAQVVVYRDYDAANQATCDTHMYVDVVKENSGTLSNWGRQCISNEWANHASSGYTQTSNTISTSEQCHSFDRYGLEHDNSVNTYIFVYSGCNNNDGQIWSIPIAVNINNNTLVIGTETLLHDWHVCSANGSCSSTNTYRVMAIESNVYAQQTSDANRMWIFFKGYDGGNYYGAFRWFKSYQCSFSATPSTSDTCSVYNQFARDLTTSQGTDYLKQNWYDQLDISVWWDNVAQTFIILNRTYQSGGECRFFQMRIAENYNSGNNDYSSNKLAFVHGNSGITDDISGGTFSTSGSSIMCGQIKQRPIFVPEHDSYIWVMSSGSTNVIDHYFLHIKGDTTSFTGAPVEVGKGSLKNLITDETCDNVSGKYCSHALSPDTGHLYIDDTVSPYKYYWHNKGMQDRNLCPNDYQGAFCAEIFEWSFNASSELIDPTTFKHYDYQDTQESYHNHQTRSFGVWKDQSTGVVFTLNSHSNAALDGTSNNKLHAVAFAIPDNIHALIGYVTQGGNQGASVTVYSVGAVIDGLSGLTIGEEYYVNASGDIATIGTYKIGRAIATDKIYITDAR